MADASAPDRTPATLSEAIALRVRQWLDTHPVKPGTQPEPVYLLEDIVNGRWLVRFPTGTLRWHTADWLVKHRFPRPVRPVLARVTEAA